MSPWRSRAGPISPARPERQLPPPLPASNLQLYHGIRISLQDRVHTRQSNSKRPSESAPSETVPTKLRKLEFNPTVSSFLYLRELSDVVIESRDGDTIPAHRLILAAGSIVFRTMFASDMRERKEGVVRIAEMGTKTVKLMLEFLYTGGFKDKVEDVEGYSAEDFLEVVHAGEKYCLPLMMEQAGVALVLRMKKENALELFIELKKFGEGMRGTRLEIADFIKKNVEEMAQ